jgi:hypothetical protein
MRRSISRSLILKTVLSTCLSANNLYCFASLQEIKAIRRRVDDDDNGTENRGRDCFIMMTSTLYRIPNLLFLGGKRG